MWSMATGKRGCDRPRRHQPLIAHMLVEMPFGPFPMALGVLYDDPHPTFEAAAVLAEKAAGKQGGQSGQLLGQGRPGPSTGTAQLRSDASGNQQD